VPADPRVPASTATPTQAIIKAVIDDLVDGTVNGQRCRLLIIEEFSTSA
jgi:hypothetical protein